MAARLKEMYASEVAPALQKKFGYKSVMQIPKFDKIVINVGCGEAKDNSKVVDAIMTDLATITGQKPVECKAKKSVANFKLREGMTIGAKVTLRGDRRSSRYGHLLRNDCRNRRRSQRAAYAHGRSVRQIRRDKQWQRNQ